MVKPVSNADGSVKWMGWLNNALLGVLALIAGNMLTSMNGIEEKLDELNESRLRMEGHINRHEYRLDKHDNEIDRLRSRHETLEQGRR